MRKSVLLLMFLVALLTSVKAQDVGLGNFENNNISPWMQWATSNNIAVAPNPSTSGINPSNYCAKIDVPSGWNGGIFRQGVASLLTPAHLSLKVDVYIAGPATNTLKLQLYNSASSAPNVDFYRNNVAVNTWVTLDFPLTALTAHDYDNIVFQLSVAGTLYIDNVRLENAKDMLLADFEASLDGWNSWTGAQYVQRIANPNQFVNSSTWVGRFESAGNWSGGFVKWFNTPVIHPAYVAVEADVYFTSPGTLKWHMDNQTSGSAYGGAYINITTINQWVRVRFDLSNLTQWNYRQMGFQVGGYEGSFPAFFYFDNIVLKTASTPPPPPPSIVLPNAWINELRYDNSGGTVGEFVEIVIENKEEWNLADMSVVLYAGSDGKANNTTTVDNFFAGEIDSTFQVFHYVYPPNKLVDNVGGVALVYQDKVIQFLSYKGSFTATDGPAQGLVSTKIKPTQIVNPADYSLQLIGLGNRYQHFNWIDPPASPGLINVDQTLQAPDIVPINWKYILLVFFLIAGALLYRKFRF
jgi:hypothetical protein